MADSDAAPRLVGRYAIFDEIGSGGMATVYLGRLMGSGGFSRTVAIKRLHPQLAKNPEFVAMFLDEARLAARIRHPNVVPTLDVVASRGELFHVIEYVQGESLSHLSREVRSRGGRVPVPLLVRIMSDVLEGLHAAHEARDDRGVALNIVHRDVTPQNVLVGVDGVARLLDFGVAKAAGRAQTTQEGQIKGKLAYMAPEQLMGSGVGRGTDLYAASVVLWEMLTGERLFTGDTELDVVAKLLARDIRSPGSLIAGICPALDALVMRGLSAKPSDRFATAREMSAALRSCGVAEATSTAVGEWVEHLAASALASRTATLASIETVSERMSDDPSWAGVVERPSPYLQRPAGPSDGPAGGVSDTSRPLAGDGRGAGTAPPPWPPGVATVVEGMPHALRPSVAAPEPAAPGPDAAEPAPDLSRGAMSVDSFQRRARLRLWAQAAALATLLLVVATALVVSVARELPKGGPASVRPPAVEAPGPSSVRMAPAPPVVVLPPPSAPPADTLAPLLTSSARRLSPPATPHPTSTPAGRALPSATAAPGAPQSKRPPTSGTTDERVFETRE